MRTRLLSLALVLGSALSAFAAEPKSKPKEAEKPKAKEPPPSVAFEDPAIEAIIATPTGSPAELVRRGLVVNSMGRPEIARRQFGKALALKPNPQQLISLGAQLGSAKLLVLRDDKLAPEGGQLADAIEQAVGANSRKADRMPTLITDLQSPDDAVRRRAAGDLLGAREVAIVPLLRVAADPQRAAEHPAVRGVLAMLSGDGLRPLVACLDADDPRIVAAAATALADAKAVSAVSFLLPVAFGHGDAGAKKSAEDALRRLLGKLPERSEAAAHLAEEARRYFQRVQPVSLGPEGQAELWVWDTAAKAPLARPVPSDDLSRHIAARFARDAHRLLPDDARLRLLYLLTGLEEAAYAAGLDVPLKVEKGTITGDAAALGPTGLEDVLAAAMRENRPAAASAAARILGELPGAADLLSRRSDPAPLVLALRHPDRRLRFAAIEALMRIRPARPYPGSSYAIETLRFLAGSAGGRRALVGGPNSLRARTVAGLLTSLGFDADIAVNGRDVLRLTLESPDYELMLLDPGIDQPPLEFLVQQIRRDGRTAGLPIGIVASTETLPRARHIAEQTPRALAFPYPLDAEAAKWEVDRVLALAGSDVLPPPVRQAHALAALRWLAELAQDPAQRGLYDLVAAEDAVLRALRNPALALAAAEALAYSPTAAAQKTLVDLASAPAQPIATRNAAAAAFHKAVSRVGVLLTLDEIKLQYDRYNQSAALDKDTQQVLAAVLDSIEAPSKALRTKNGKPNGKPEAKPDVQPPSESAKPDKPAS